MIVNKTTNNKLLNNYCCELWVKSADSGNLKDWIFLLPKVHRYAGLPTKIRRFTLLRSPLGNKKSKDQYELKEYGVYINFISRNLSLLLNFLFVVRNPAGVKLKIKISRIL